MSHAGASLTLGLGLLAACSVETASPPSAREPRGRWADSDDQFGMIWISDEFKRQLAVDAWRYVILRTTEFHPGGNEVYDHLFSTSYDLVAISARGSHELYLAGEAPRSDLIVERWIIQPNRGAFTTTVNLAANPSGGPSPLGTPTPVAPLLTTQSGGTSTPLHERIPNPPVQRIELYRGDDYGTAIAITPDPDGRFVIVLNDLGQMVQFDLLDEIVPPLVVADSVSHWPLAEAKRMTRVQHDTYGRVWFVGAGTQPGPDGTPMQSTYTVFMDFDNDGVFDSDTMMSHFALLDSDFMDSSLISDQFIGY